MIIQRFLRPSAGTVCVVCAAALCCGAIAPIAARAAARSAPLKPAFETIYSLPAGSHPWGTPAVDGAGVVYGTTSYGGVGDGDVYGVTPPHGKHSTWRGAVLTNFMGADGQMPMAGVAVASDGKLYGTTQEGGYGGGTVFSLTPPTSGQYYWNEKVLHAFEGRDDGAAPFAGLALAADGSLYGTTTTSAVSFCGLAFRLAPPTSRHGVWTETILSRFVAPNAGCQPFAGLVADGAGNYYGTAVDGGGACACGNVFELSPPASGSGAWTDQTLYEFGGPSAGDGSGPYGTLTIGRDGALYGTTLTGGTANEGIVFRLAPPRAGSSAWRETVLHSFTGGSDGAAPYGGVVVGPDRRVYGTTFGGSSKGLGTAFMLIPPVRGASLWRERLLHAFSGVDGAKPYASLAFGPDGALYGATYAGGTFGGGAVFRIAP